MSIKRPRRNTKTFAILKHFATGKTLHRFQAARLGDSCLNSTVPSITRQYGIRFNRESIEVQNNYGGLTRCTRYWLENGQLEKAKGLTQEKIICFDTPQKVQNFLANNPKAA